MHHIAIMKKSWGLIPKILNGEKTIESRWYMARYAPWDRIKAGDIVYFKNSGEPVTTKTRVSKVLQFVLVNKSHPEFSSGSELKQIPNQVRNDNKYKVLTVKQILQKYGKKLGIEDTDWFCEKVKSKKYCILIFLKNPKRVKPFNIDKSGFGTMSAWISINKIDLIKTH